MLSAALEDAQAESDWRDYVAQNIWAIGKMQLADPSKYPFPSWIELAQKGAGQPDMTGEDIRNDLRRKWGGGE